MDCTKLNCPMQTGTATNNCADNCQWRTTLKDGDLISRAAAIARIDKCVALSGIGLEPVMAIRDVKALISAMPAVDAVPIKPLSGWLAGYAVPPKYTVATNPVDSVKARAEGWEQHIRNLIECGLMEDE